MGEVRYWPRIGMRVEREVAEAFLDKLADVSVGSILDEDLDEFVNVTPLSREELNRELNKLFENPPDPTAPAFDEFNSAILGLMDFEANRKEFILECKAEGMTLDEAKVAYENGKAELVREHLDIPNMDTPQDDEE
jgi:hypothetical protein